jgi:hypothetical protein
MATGPAPTPAAPSAIQPNDAQPEQRAPQSGAQPNQPAANSNTPDADTAAAKSMPAALANNPQVPSQKIASTIDDNKNSDSPAHSALYKAAIEMTGGQRYTSTTDADGNIVRTPIQPKPWALGLALALNVLSGGMAGMGAKTTGEAAQLGAQEADKQRLAVKTANQDQDAQAKADQDHKLAVTGANLRNYMTSVNAGKSSMAASQAFGDSYKDWAGFSDGTIPLPPGMTKSDPQWETDATAAVKNSKTNITRDFLFPIGDPKPVYGKDGKQVTVNGIPQVGHDFVTLHGIGPNSTMTLTKAMQQSFIDAGIMAEPTASIGEPQWPMSDIAKKSALLASINTGEQMLEDHKNDTMQLLGHAGHGGKDGNGVQDLDDLKAAIKSDPRLSKALGVFSQAQMGTSGANGHIEDILNTMGQRDPTSRGVLMNHLGLSEADLDAMHNKRAANAAAATAEGKGEAKPMTMEAAKDELAKADLDPNKPVDVNGMQGGRKLTDDQKRAYNLLSNDDKSKSNLKAKELQDTRTVQDQDIVTAAKNIVTNPNDPVSLKSISSLRGDERLRLFNEVKKQGGDVSALDRKSKMLDQYENGKQADQIQSYQTFVKHAGDLYSTVQSLNRPEGTPKWIDKPLNWLEQNASSDPAIGEYLAKFEPVRDEILTFLKNNHAALQMDAESMGKVLDPSQSPAYIQRVVKSLAKTGQYRLDSINSRYKHEFKQDFDGLYDDESRDALKTMGMSPTAAGNAGGNAGGAAATPKAKPTAYSPNNPFAPKPTGGQ